MHWALKQQPSLWSNCPTKRSLKWSYNSVESIPVYTTYPKSKGKFYLPWAFANNHAINLRQSIANQPWRSTVCLAASKSSRCLCRNLDYPFINASPGEHKCFGDNLVTFSSFNLFHGTYANFQVSCDLIYVYRISS